MKLYAFDAMCFAREAHARQVRKYTGENYCVHLAEVAGITASATARITIDPLLIDTMVSVAWLHDYIEDQRPEHDHDGRHSWTILNQKFGRVIADGVMALSDLELGTRAERKALARERLSQAHGWIQTIKVANLISNLPGICKHDRAFAPVFLEETSLLLDVLPEADTELVSIARGYIDNWEKAK